MAGREVVWTDTAAKQRREILNYWACGQLTCPESFRDWVDPPAGGSPSNPPSQAECQHALISNNVLDAIESKAKNHMVMIGTACENGEAVLNGTEFIVAWKGEVYVVTCRHVLDETEGNIFFAVPKLRHTLDPKPYGYPSLLLGRSQYFISCLSA